MNKLAKERIIFQNYDLDGYEEEYKEMCEENGEEFSENAMWNWVYFILDEDFRIALAELENHFNNKVIAFGSIGRWNGVYDGSKIFNNFKDAYWAMTEDCHYIKIYDENGHLFVHCSHHDGSCTFEIKELTKKGEEYYDRWNYGNDSRTEAETNTQIIKRYSIIPNFAHKVYGCKVREYEPTTKESLQKKLNNKAMSFYS